MAVSKTPGAELSSSLFAALRASRSYSTLDAATPSIDLVYALAADARLAAPRRAIRRAFGKRREELVI